MSIVLFVSNTKLNPIFDEIVIPGHFDLTGIFTGGIILVISEVFRIGIKIQKENELTV